MFAELGDGDRQEVGSERERLAVEVAGGVGEALIAAIALRPVRAELQIERLAVVGKEERIVGRGVDLALGDVARVARWRRASRRAPAARSGASRRPAPRRLRSTSRLPSSSVADRGGALDLARMPARLVDFRIEGARAAARAPRASSAARGVGDCRRGVSASWTAEREHRRGEVRAVDERESFLERRLQLLAQSKAEERPAARARRGIVASRACRNVLRRGGRRRGARADRDRRSRRPSRAAARAE